MHRWLLLGWVVQAGCVHLLYPPREAATEILHTTTDDGWQLALHRFAPGPGLPARRHPVIVCHGVSSNKNNWDLTDRLSLPSVLQSLGFDVWLVELRASGASETPGWFSDKDWSFTFDDYVLHDAPALIQYVLKTTGAKQVHWVGHSMGGIVMYAYLQRVEQGQLRSVATVASPPWLLDHTTTLAQVVALLPVLNTVWDELPLGTLAKLSSPLAAYPLLPHQHLVWNPDNMSHRTARLAAANAVDNASGQVLVQLTRSLDEHALRSADGQINYSAGLSVIEVPMLFAAGALDHLAPPAAVMDAYRRVASSDKALVIFSRANGFSHDYGHVDLVIGETAPLDVFPVLAEWVVQHD